MPPTCGFFSKWYLVSGAFEAGRWEFAVALLVSSLINAVLFFRVIEYAYFGKFPEIDSTHDHSEEHHQKKLLSLMRIRPQSSSPLILSAVAVIAVGLFNKDIAGFLELFLNSVSMGGE